MALGDSGRHKLRGMWFNFSQNRSAEFDREINWGDVTFPIDTTIESVNEFDIYELAYEYAFLRRENLELSGSFGLHLAQFKVGLSAEVIPASARALRKSATKGSSTRRCR